MTRRFAVATLSSLVVLIAACSGGHRASLPRSPSPTPATTPTSPTTAKPVTTTALGAKPVAQARVAGVGLTRFAGCPELLASVRSQALAEVQPWGLPYQGGPNGPGPIAVDGPVPAAPAGAAAGESSGAGGSTGASGSASAGGAAAGAPASSPSGVPGFSSTNNQEAGVDEPDVAKTDGHLLVTLRDGGAVLQVIDVQGAPHLLGSVALPQQFNGELGLFLVGGDAVVLGQAFDNQSRPRTEVWVVSLADPNHPAISRTFSVDGTETAARLLGRNIKLVVTSGPRLAFVPPRSGSTSDQQAALSANKATIAAAPVTAWLPNVIDGADHRQPADCALVSHTSAPAGLGTTSVISIDPDLPEPGPAVTVIGDPEAVYASSSDLYVATTNSAFTPYGASGQAPDPANVVSQVHDFDITDAAQAAYVGSGVVPGTVLNQYSMSENAGDFRIATTVGTPAPPPNEGGPVAAPDLSQSYVTVLRRSGGALTQIGQVGGLGQGQKIYAVRFVGSLAYVVTFRQLDPLYVVDLSDPAHPAVRGALELSGYSAYLHPVADGLVLGVGASADANARRTGLQVSLFNVSDPAHPSLVGQDLIGDGTSAVEQDPHAFLWWAPTHLAVVPVQTWCSSSCASPNGGGGAFDGVVALRVEAGGVVEIGRITHDGRPGAAGGRPASGGGAPAGGGVASGGGAPAGGGPAAGGGAPSAGGAPGIQRALVVGSILYTVSDSGVLASSLSSLHDVSWLPY